MSDIYNDIGQNYNNVGGAFVVCVCVCLCVHVVCVWGGLSSVHLFRGGARRESLVLHGDFTHHTHRERVSQNKAIFSCNFNCQILMLY
jgi:hypothetical protein